MDLKSFFIISVNFFFFATNLNLYGLAFFIRKCYSLQYLGDTLTIKIIRDKKEIYSYINRNYKFVTKMYCI